MPTLVSIHCICPWQGLRLKSSHTICALEFWILLALVMCNQSTHHVIDFSPDSNFVMCFVHALLLLCLIKVMNMITTLYAIKIKTFWSINVFTCTQHITKGHQKNQKHSVLQSPYPSYKCSPTILITWQYMPHPKLSEGCSGITLEVSSFCNDMQGI